jgi:hypothetical protein
MTQEEYMVAIGRHLDTPVKDFLQHGGECNDDNNVKPKKLFHSNEPMSRDEFYAAIDDYKNRKLEHATKWKSHKNLKLIGDRYVYEDEEARARSDEAQDAGKKRTEAMRAGLKKAATAAGDKAQESGKARTESLKKGMAENAIKKYQEDGMKRTAKEQAGREKLAKSASSVRAGDHSAEDAEEKMKGFDLWKKRQAQMKANARIKHANEPMTRDEFYAAVNDYKQKH